MDAFVVGDSETVTTSVVQLLHRHGVDCQQNHVSMMGTTAFETERLRGFRGLVFFVIRQIRATDLELLQIIRATIAPSGRVVLISSISDHGTMLKAIRAGAADILAIDQSLDEEIGRCIASVLVDDEKITPVCKVFTVVPCHSRPDANILSVNLASAIARISRPCGLLDFHFRGGDIALLLNLRPQYTILDLLSQGNAVDESMFRQSLTPHDTGIELLAGPPSFGELKHIHSQTCQEIIRLGQHRWPAMVINCEDIQHAEQIRALAMSNEILLAMHLDIASLQRTRQHIDFLVENQVAREQIHVVALGAGHSGELPLAEVKRFLELPDLLCIPDEPSPWTISVNRGRPLIVDFPKSKAATAITALVNSMFKVPDCPRKAVFTPALGRVASILSLCAAPAWLTGLKLSLK